MGKPSDLSEGPLDPRFKCKNCDISVEVEKDTLADRIRTAITKWVPLSSLGAAISFVAGFMLNVPQPQIIISAAMTAILVFSGLAMQSYGRGRDLEAKKAQP